MENSNENLPEPDFEEEDFTPCSECDGHDACHDFGCAIKLGLGHLVQTQYLNF